MEENQIVIYTSPKGEVYIEARLKDDTVWLTQKQIAELFDVQVPAVSKHIQKILADRELKAGSTVSKMEIVQKEGARKVKRQSEVYNLDMVISVGYRINSVKATQFRVWATKTLKSYLVKGYAVNEKLLRTQREQLKEIKQTIIMISKKSEADLLSGREKDLLGIIAEYAKSWRILDEFDANRLQLGRLKNQVEYELEYSQSSELVDRMRVELFKSGIASELFGNEIDHKFKAIIGSINQTFDGEQLYPSIEEKASHLLYFVIKDHPFSDGNKRIGSLLFLHFLQRNDYLYRKTGELKINDNSVIALALLIALSNPKEKDDIVKLIINIIRD